MKQVCISRCLKISLQVLLSASFLAYFLVAALPAYAASTRQQASTPMSSSTCPVIPKGFDFAHASNQELRHYHIPSRPATSDQKDLANWLKDVQGVKKIVCLPANYSNPVVNNGYPVISAPALVNCPNTAPSGTTCSQNWNGYVAGGGGPPGFNDIYATWNVQCVNTAKSPSDSMETSWVGLGGAGLFAGDPDLWQGGSGWSVSRGYYLWYEAVGANGTNGEQEIVQTQCGETIHAEVWFAPGAPSSNVGIDILDVQQDIIYTRYAPSGFSSGKLTAEWIDERPSCGQDSNGHNKYYRLADYNYSQWRDAYASTNNPTDGYHPIGAFARTRLWMADSPGSNTRIAWTDAPGSENGGSGTDNYQTYWEANGTSQCG